MGLLGFLLLMLISVTDTASRAWRDGQSRAETFQSGRTALELLARELAPAVVDTRLQFVVGPGRLLADGGAAKVAPESPAILWMSPLGEAGDLRCVGYYLYRNEARNFFRLKRIYIAPRLSDGSPAPYFPRMVDVANPFDAELRTSPVDASWFLRRWDGDTFDEQNPGNSRVVVSTAADGVIAFWVQPLDLLDRPIPRLSESKTHPRSELWFNSAAYFQMATTTPFDTGETTQYLAKTEQVMKANRLPAAVEFTIVTIDSRTLQRGVQLPAQVSLYDEHDALDVRASLREFEKQLGERGVTRARTFSTRVKLINGN